MNELRNDTVANLSVKTMWKMQHSISCELPIYLLMLFTRDNTAS